jgi:ribosomal protein S18 acetylase RimI-like enzyme
MSTPSFRQATVADIARLHTHVHHAYRGDEARKGWTSESHLLDGQRTDKRELQALIEGDDAQLWLLERGDELLASMVVKRESEEVAHVGMIAVDPEQQGQGAGRALLEKAEQVARELGCTRVEMTVIGQREELIAWYERRGYTRTEEQRPFPYGDQRFGLPKLRDLYFVVLVKSV